VIETNLLYDLLMNRRAVESLMKVIERKGRGESGEERRLCGELLDRMEEIKSQNNSNNNNKEEEEKERKDQSFNPSVGNSLTDREVGVLRDSSRVNGRLFYPWLRDEEKYEQFQYTLPFSDPDGPLPLNTKQTRSPNFIFLLKFICWW